MMLLLACGVQVMTTRGQRRLQDRRCIPQERSDHVADDLPAVEERGQRFAGSIDRGDFVVGSFNARYGIHHLLELGLVSPGGYKRNAVLAQELRDQSAGVSARSIDDDRACLAHGCSFSTSLLFMQQRCGAVTACTSVQRPHPIPVGIPVFDCPRSMVRRGGAYTDWARLARNSRTSP